MRYSKGITCLIGIVLINAWVLAQGVPLNLRFHDSVTGRALVVDIQLTNTLTQASYSLRSRTDGRAELNLPEGDYILYATAEDYQAVGLTMRLEPQMPPYRFFLDPNAPPVETRTEFLWSLRKPGQMVVVGWLMDEETGQPIVGARVGVLEIGTMTLTDERGLFLVQFPIAPCKTGYATLLVEKAGYRTRRLEKVRVWSEGDWIYRLTLTPGVGVESTDMRSPRHREDEPIPPCTDCEKEKTPTELDIDTETPSDFMPTAPAPIVLPKYIRVGRNCSRNNRTDCPGGVEVYTIDTYCKGVITSEWYACWGNLPGGMNSLYAGAVAVRSYGVSFVFSPVSPQYDICDSTACQVFTGNQTSNGNAAVDFTTRYVLLTSAGAIARSEYSAENNNAGCGDGYSGTGSGWPCIFDPVCSGFSTNGHGRGMCQWGSARWATGRRLSSSQACTTQAPQHSFGTKNWQEILNHYYAPAGYQLVQGGVATITNLITSPNPISTGATGLLTFNINATHDFSVMLGASIRLGSGSWISDPPRDVKVNLSTGTQSRNRTFLIPNNAQPGTYDVLTTLWFDRNNSNTINQGDFLVDDRIFSTVWQVRRTTSMSMNPLSARRGQTVSLSATLRQALDNSPLANKPITFRVNNQVVGTANTNSSGIASLSYTLPLNLPLGTVPLRADFTGDSEYAPTLATSSLSVQPVRLQGQVALEGRPNPAGVSVRLVIQQGTNTETLTTTLGTNGAYQVDTALAGDATVRLETLTGAWLCQSSSILLSGIATLNFSLKAGDVNRDGVIDDADLLAVLFAFGNTGSNLPEDLNGDGVVDDADLLTVLFNFGSGC